MTLDEFILKFPEHATLTTPQFDMMLVEARIEMGVEPSRWLGDDLYEVAQAYLVAHLAAVSSYQRKGDPAPLAPLRMTEVEGVTVEYAISRDSLQAPPNWLSTTSYGQQYLRFRRMAFAGPRVA